MKALNSLKIKKVIRWNVRSAIRTCVCSRAHCGIEMPISGLHRTYNKFNINTDSLHPVTKMPL